MKKSQVLAALALAFALGLGVIAPVANTYAAISYPDTVKSDERTEFVDDANSLISSVNDLEGYPAYASLIGYFEGKDSVAAKMKEAVKDSLKDYNTLANSVASNSASDLIGKANEIISKKSLELTLKVGVDATNDPIVAVSPLSSTSSLETAYATAKRVLAQASDNSRILTANYYTTESAYQSAHPEVTTLSKEVKAAIKDAADLKSYSDQIVSLLDDTAGNGQATGFLGKMRLAINSDAFSGNTSNAATTINTIVTAIGNIDGKAKEALVDNAEWHTTFNRGALDYAENFTLAMQAAKALPKYNLALAVYNAKNNVNDALTSSTSYSYAKAQELVGLLETAIANYENGSNAGENAGSNKTTTLETVTEDGTIITVTGEFEEGVTVYVKTSDKEVKDFGDRKFAMWDITLMKDGKKYDFKGEAVVTIKFGDLVDGSKAGVYYVAENGEVSFMKGSKIENGVATFKTTHFSLYAIVEDAAAGLPNTGVIMAAVEGNASTTVAMVAGIATALTAAGAGVVAYRNARRSVRK